MDHLDRADRFSGRRGHRALLLALPPGRLADASGEPGRGRPEQRARRQGDQREGSVEPEHDRRHADQRECVGKQRQQRRDRDVLQEPDVPRDTHEQVTAPRPGVKREGETLELAVQLVPDGREDAVADEREADGVVVGGERPQAREHDHGYRGQREQHRRIERVEEREPGEPAVAGHAGDAVQHPLQRPGLEQPQDDLGVQREQ